MPPHAGVLSAGSEGRWGHCMVSWPPVSPMAEAKVCSSCPVHTTTMSMGQNNFLVSFLTKFGRNLPKERERRQLTVTG